MEIYVRVLNSKLLEVNGDLNQAKEEIIRFRQAIQEAIEFFSSKETSLKTIENLLGEQTEESQGYISKFLLYKSHIETYTLRDKQQMNQSMEKFVKQNGSQYLAWYQYLAFEQ